MQRFFDLLFSIFSIIILSPILIIIIIILSLSGEKKIFYLQKRVGKMKKIFFLYKFVTMLENSPNIGTGDITIVNDPRVLPFGKFLRKFKLNELPQLINVMKGEMSLVGPRPLTVNAYNNYSLKDQEVIMRLTPGLSGVGSIYFSDEEKFYESKENVNVIQSQILSHKAKLEKWYSENLSIKTYFIVIFSTLLLFLFKKKKVFKYFFPRHLINRDIF
ncbi:sugar transferase [Pelagibacteraceae bacterium]|nr:sugar transferase [Pelagibacteraceae bacterium]